MILSIIGDCQPYSVPLFFEDAAGNKDTVFFGFDDSATFGVDDFLDEKNIINESIDSVFAVFFTDATTNEPNEEHCLEKTQNPTYILKKQFNNYNSFPNPYLELGIITKNWPVTIRWSQVEIENFLADQGHPTWNVYIFSWHPPESFVGDVHCCGFWPGDYTFLKDTSQIVVNYDNFCHYASTISKDSVNLFYIEFSVFTNIKETGMKDIHFWFNANEKKIFISNTPDNSNKFEVFDMLGRVRIKKSFNYFAGSKFEIDVSSLSKGIYILRLTSTGVCSHQFNKKFQIQ